MPEHTITSNVSEKAVRVACDVGGTFTDVCVLNEATGQMHVAKTPTTPDPIDGVLNGIEKSGVNLSDMILFSHGTTLATNALITRKFPPAVMVTTKGFRDVIEIRRGRRQHIWDTYAEMAGPYIRRRDRLVVTERTDYAGNIVEPLNEEEARKVARVVKKRGAKTVAVCFFNAFTNPENEQRMKEILLEEMPDASISLSSEIMPEIFEHERFSTTVANAVLAPVAGDYTRDLADRLAEGGYKEDTLLLHSGGGVLTAKNAYKLAGRLAGSGIAAGAIASRTIAQLAGYENSISFDMGGTSTDVSLCDNGKLPYTKDWYVEYGYPIRFPSIELKTIGAGGGSLAWIDEGGSLRSGPQSAGSDPGPVCYGRGGTEPTNTDANVLLGRLGTRLAGGDVSLDIKKAEEAIKRVVADPLGLTPEEAALAILKVANANMGDAVRLVSISKGYDPRDFALVAFGGAGALHAASIAKELSIPTVLIPPNPGVTSALGCFMVDLSHDISRMYLGNVKEVDLKDLTGAFEELEAEGREHLLNEGVTEDHMEFKRYVDMRYLGQWRSLSIPVGRELTSLDDAVAEFHLEHGREHNYSRPDAPVEVYRISVTAVAPGREVEFPKHEVNGAKLPSPRDRRMVRFDEEPKQVETPVYDRDDIPAGAKLEGPVIIEQLDSTIMIPPDTTAQVDPWLTIKMTIPVATS
jgi:N-methylhydantoinase A